jgi:thioredoxin-related protein
MRKLAVVGALILLDILVAASGLSTAVNAGLDFNADVPATAETMELVVMEAPGCVYCTLFRRDVLPSYTASQQAKDLPIRFVDLNDEAANALGLDGPIDVVPTFVVMKNNHEVGRIPGYMGPEFFFHSINHIISGSG